MLLCASARLLVVAAAAAATVTGTGASTATAAPIAIANRPVMIDMVQNNPGDPVGWQQTKYFDPRELKKLDYTGMPLGSRIWGQKRFPPPEKDELMSSYFLLF